MRKENIEMFQIKKKLILKNVGWQQQNGPIVMKPMYFYLWSIYVFLLLFVLKRHRTNLEGRLTARATRIIIALCIQSEDDILLQPERTMQNMSFHSQRWENVGTQAKSYTSAIQGDD